MKDIELPREETERLSARIKDYFASELDQEIGGFEAEFLIDFFISELGPHMYNRGLADAHSAFREKAEEFGYVLQEMEKTLP